jgi:hypothetical protein
MTSMLSSRGGEGVSASHAQALALIDASWLKWNRAAAMLGTFVANPLLKQPDKYKVPDSRSIRMRLKPLRALVVCLLFVRPPQILAEQREDARTATTAYSIPEGTPFKLHLHSTISSKTSRMGDRVLTTLVDPVAVQDMDVLPKGLRIGGSVAEVEAAGHRGKSGCLTIVF